MPRVAPLLAASAGAATVAARGIIATLTAVAAGTATVTWMDCSGTGC
jgi:hypothetical protein